MAALAGGARLVLMCWRILSMSCGWVTSAMTRRRPLQSTQVVTSISNVRLRRSAHDVPPDSGQLETRIPSLLELHRS